MNDSFLSLERKHQREFSATNYGRNSMNFQNEVPSFANKNSLAMQYCSANDEDRINADGKPPVFAITLMERPNIIEIDEKIPSQVTLFPLIGRPLFPVAKVRARQFSVSNISSLDVRWKQVIDRMKPSVNSNFGRSLAEVKNPATSVGAQSSMTVFSTGPTIISEREFVEHIVKLKNAGESYIALSLSFGKQTSNPVENVHPIGVLARLEDVGEISILGQKLYEVFFSVTHRVAISALPSHATVPINLKSASAPSQERFPRVSVKEVKDETYSKDSRNARAALLALTGKISEISAAKHPMFASQFEVISYRISQREYGELAYLCASLCVFEAPEKLQAILMETNVIERMKKVTVLLKNETEVLKLLSETKPQGPVTATSSPMKRREASEKNTKVINEFKERLKNLAVPDHALKVIDEEMNKLSSLDPVFNATEHYTCRNYLNWLTSMPWGVYTKDNLQLNQAEKVLDEDHYGLEEVKQRISEFIAVASLKGSLQGKILCFVGPPGVGKTSMGKSIARSLNRKFFRFSVGGMNDVAEIKGHRRTYIGALPGKLIQSLKVTKAFNPVILIDEIDKISKHWDGDPASALLEALDPEQNSNFLDHYLDVPIDLGKVLFVCTANTTETIPRPLLDRMEIIKLAGYFIDEKVQIAKRHLIPSLSQQTGLSRLQIDDSALNALITGYCREAGVRSLNKYIERIFRKVAHKIAKAEVNAGTITVTANELQEYVGKPKFHTDRIYVAGLPPGVVPGLAYNTEGGSLIWIETVVVPTNERPSLKTTGKLGDVIRESTEIAYTFARKFALECTPKSRFFDETSFHMHFPEGAVPKDGPSAGCAIVTSFISLFLNKPIKTNLAMTGEITLTGKVLPVGGIREKTMAAQRSGMKTLILPDLNKRDFDDLPDKLKTGIEVHYASSYKDIFPLLFQPNASL